MAKVLEEALSIGKMLFYHFISILIDSMRFFTDAYNLFWFYLISKLFGRRFYFSNQFLVPIIKSELVLSSTEKGKHNKIVDYILYCSSKITRFNGYLVNGDALSLVLNILPRFSYFA
ncbi:hypothetical protein YC2023_056573 [Brassica napus]